MPRCAGCATTPATLFGFDPYGNVYVHAGTHQSIHWLWHELVGAQNAAAPAVGPDTPSHGAAPPFDRHYANRRPDAAEPTVAATPAAAALSA
jgi:hypothetical protein